MAVSNDGKREVIGLMLNAHASGVATAFRVAFSDDVDEDELQKLDDENAALLDEIERLRKDRIERWEAHTSSILSSMEAAIDDIEEAVDEIERAVEVAKNVVKATGAVAKVATTAAKIAIAV